MLPALKIETGPHGRNRPWPHRFRPATNATATNAMATNASGAAPFPQCRIAVTRGLQGGIPKSRDLRDPAAA